MTRCSFLSALTAVLFLPAVAIAEPAAEPMPVVADESMAPVVADSVPAAELGWDQFDDPGFDPAESPESAMPEPEMEVAVEDVTDEPSDQEILGSVPEEPDAGTQIQLESAGVQPPVAADGVILGPRGVDDLGRAGRLHTVARGDTLWDLSAAYLGTPWVWPSVWIDNDDIANPHLINPGDKIWITANEMRVVTDAEAEAFLVPVADTSDAAEDSGDAISDGDLAADDETPVAAFDDSGEEPSTLEAFPISVPSASGAAGTAGRRVTVARREAMGFVSTEEFEGSSSIVGSPNERTYLAQGDDVILGVGEGDVQVGDRFSIFSVIEEVREADSMRLLGHHVESLGWVQVKELTGDTSVGEIEMSYSEIARGARIIQYDPAPTSVEVRNTPDAIEGKVVFLPSERTLMAGGGYVYLDRGEFHGVEMGSELEVFDRGAVVGEPARRVDVRTPDNVVARLVVVSVQPGSSVGFVVWSNRELAVGDSIRPWIPRLAQR